MKTVIRRIEEMIRSGIFTGVIAAVLLIQLWLPAGIVQAGDTNLPAERQARHAARQIQLSTPVSIMAPVSHPFARVSASADWPVILDDQPSRMIQKNPVCLGGIGDGGLIFFLDERNGPMGLWGAVVDAAGTPAGGNHSIQQAGGLAGLGIPAAARTGAGANVVAFPDGDASGIFALPVDDDLIATGPLQRVSDAAADGNALFDRPDIAATSGGAVVVWEDYRFGSRVYARSVDATGVPSAGEFIVHEDLTVAQRWVPRVAAGDSDTLMFVWEDYRSAEPDVYYRVFTATGTPVTGDLPAVSGGASAAQYQPDIIYSPDYGFLLTWIDLRDGTATIYGRIINEDGTPADAEFVLSAPGDTAVFWEPALAGDGSQQAVVVYESVAQRTVVTGQRLFLGAPFGNAFTISDPTAPRDRFSPAVAYRDAVGMLAVWTDFRTDNSDIRARSLNLNAEPVGDDSQINDDNFGNQQLLGDAARWFSLGLLAAYTDKNRDDGDIYVQRSLTTGELIGEPTRINDDPTAARQAEPTVKMHGDGTVYVAWTDARTGPSGSQFDIYFQMLLPDFTPSGSNVRLTDDTNFGVQIQPDLALFPGGGAIAVWTDYRHGSQAGIYGQVVDESSNREGPNFRIDTTFARPDDTPAKVAAFNLENSAIVWRAEGASDSTLWILWYNRAVGAMGDPFPLDVDSADFVPTDFDVVALPGAGFGVVWRAEAEDRAAIFFQEFNNFFFPVGPNLLISDGGYPLPGRVSVDVDFAGYLVYAWTEDVGGKSAAMQRIFDPFGAPIGPVEIVSQNAGVSISYDPIAIATGQYAAVLFTDNRTPGRGFDVRGSYYQYSTTDIFEDEDETTVPNGFSLAQNYPNPFNPSTVINFTVPAAGEYTLTVYDILGRQIRVLWDGYREAGAGTFTWEGRDKNNRSVSSGVYFYRLRGADVSSTRKMTLVK